MLITTLGQIKKYIYNFSSLSMIQTLRTFIDFDGTIADTIWSGITTSSFNSELFMGLLEFFKKNWYYAWPCDNITVKSLFKWRSSYEALESLGLPDSVIQMAFSNVQIPISWKELGYVYSQFILDLLRQDPNAYIISDSFSRSIMSVPNALDYGGIPNEKVYANDVLAWGKVKNIGKLPMMMNPHKSNYIIFGDTDTDKELAESTKALSPESEVLFIKTFPKAYHLQKRYYIFLIKQLYSKYWVIMQDLSAVDKDQTVYISFEESKKTLEFSRSIPMNPALSLQKI